MGIPGRMPAPGEMEPELEKRAALEQLVPTLLLATT